MSQELVPVGDTSPFALLRMSGSDAAELVRDALGGEKLSAGDLDRVKVPAGGAVSWEVPTLDGEISMKVLEGVVVHRANRRAYWPYSMEDRPDDDDGRPVCQSFDGEVGLGDPGGNCAECPFNEFGSDIKGGPGKACKETRQLFLLTKDDLLPIAVTIPPASLANVKAYFLRLLRAQLSPSDVVTRLTIAKEKNSRGTAYGRVELTAGERLDADAKVRMRQYATMIAPAVQAATEREVDRSDIDG